MEKKILVVNYQPQRLKEWKETLSEIGETLFSASNGAEALEIFEKEQPDLIVIDPMLPKKSGFDVIKEIKESNPDTKVIVVASVHKGAKYQALAKNTYKVDEFLEDPVDADILKEKAAKIIGFSVDSKALEDLMGAKSEPALNFENQSKPKKKKVSTKKRFEEIIEETLSGKIVEDLPTKKVKKSEDSEDEKVFTSEELFSDVISEVEETFMDNKAEAAKEKPKKKEEKGITESVEAEIEEKLEKTLSGLKIDKKKKSKKVVIERKPEPKPAVEPKAEEKEAKKEEKEDKKEKAKSKKKEIEYGNYLLLDKVATGGMAELFKAKRRGVQGFQKIVAIKRILPHLVENEDFVTMFIDEAKLAAQLNHPNIAQIYDLGKIEDTFYIAMEYVEGHDLRKILKKCKEKGVYIPEPIVLFVAAKVLSALDYAHRKKGLDNKDLNIVHRDISPQNIILSLEGDVKLVDFGIAKAATKASQTQAGALKGKLLYMSPEQAWGEKVDKRSDLFSLGSVMYEALTGKKCFIADSEISILEKVRNVVYTPIREINPRVSEKTARIIEKALTKDPDKRYQSAKEMEQDILEILNSLPYTVNERTVAEFVNALYNDDMDALKKLSEKLYVEQPLKVEELKDGESEDFSISEEDLEPDEHIEEIPDRRANTGTVVVPTPEDLEKYEEESLKKIEEEQKGSKKALIGGLIAAVVVVGIIAFLLTGKKKEQPKASAEPTTQTVQQEQTESPATEQTEEQQPAQESANTVADTAVNENGGQPPVQADQVLSEIEKKKQQMIEELTKKKIEEQKRKLQAQLEAERKKIEEQKRLLEQQKKQAALIKTEQPPKQTVSKGTATEQKKKAEQTQLTEAKTQEKTAPQTPPVTEQPKETTASTEQATVENKPVTETEQTAKSETVKPVQQEQTAEQTQLAAQPQKIEQPKVKEGDLVPLTDDVIKPVAVKKVKPKYTLAARKKRIHGKIIAQALIDENGNVVDVRIIRNIPGRHGLDKEVKKALKKWKFEPAVKDGVKVKVYDTFIFKF